MRWFVHFRGYSVGPFSSESTANWYRDVVAANRTGRVEQG